MTTNPSNRLQSKLKKGDDVLVISGKAKGQGGKIIQVITETNRIVIGGLLMAKKHLSARKAAAMQREPGIIQKEMSIHVSNVMMKDPKTGKPTRTGYATKADGSKVRIAKKSGTEIDTIKKAAKAAPKAAKAK